MSATIENLSAEEAVGKLADIVDSSPTAMFATRLGVVPFHVCPMHVQQVDDDGSLWFFSGADSHHNDHIHEDPRVQLVFGNDSKKEFLAVSGTASFSIDRAKLDELWSKMAEAWFPAGKDDPNLSLIRVTPREIHYWDTKNGKLLTMARIFAAAVTEGPADVGVEGDLRVPAS